MIFIGDFASDYIRAYNLLTFKEIPLVGIRSSVVWLHQGPIALYLVALGLFLGKLNPVTPGVLFGILGAVTTFLVYRVGRVYFNWKIGVLSALFFATSPLVIINSRIPYHTSLIPFFCSVFFLVFHNHVFIKKNYFLLFLSLGLLIQVELANVLVLGFIFIVLLFNKIKVSLRDIFVSAVGLAVGVLPFILYDLTHNFVYSVGFPLWSMNRIRLFFGVASKANVSDLPNTFITLNQQLIAFFFTENAYLAYLILLVVIIGSIIYFVKERSIKSYFFGLFTLIFLLGYLIHTAPGPAYFPILFPALSIIVGSIFYMLIRVSKLFLVLFIILCLSNVFLLIKNSYYVSTNNHVRSLPISEYNLGSSWQISNDTLYEINKDAKGKKFTIIPIGFAKTIPTSLDTYKYIAKWREVPLVEKDGIKYYLSLDEARINKGRIIYSNNNIKIYRND